MAVEQGYPRRFVFRVINCLPNLHNGKKKLLALVTLLPFCALRPANFSFCDNKRNMQRSYISLLFGIGVSISIYDAFWTRDDAQSQEKKLCQT